jgi:hypothetical protein
MKIDDLNTIPSNAVITKSSDRVDLTLREIAKSVDLPIGVVGRLQDLKVIGSPVTNEDMIFMKKYRKTWVNFFLLKNQLAKLSKKQRNDILIRPELATKWERWVYSRFLYNEIEYGPNGEMLTPQNMIKIVAIADEVNSIFNVPKTKNVLERIRKIREMAYNDKKKINRDPQSEMEILMRRARVRDRVNLEAEFFVFDMYS